jgi:hypothetical protein
MRFTFGCSRRRSSRLPTGTPPNSWTMGAGCWFPSRIQLLSKIRQLSFWTTDATRQAMRERAYVYARHMIWNRAAQSYMWAFVRARANRMQPAGVAFPLQAGEKKATSRLINV